jgi:hypothetical protein
MDLPSIERRINTVSTFLIHGMNPGGKSTNNQRPAGIFPTELAFNAVRSPSRLMGLEFRLHAVRARRRPLPPEGGTPNKNRVFKAGMAFLTHLLPCLAGLIEATAKQ